MMEDQRKGIGKHYLNNVAGLECIHDGEKYTGDCRGVSMEGNGALNICQVILSEGWGGAETVVHELAKHLKSKGEKVSIILNHEILKYYADLENVKLLDIGPLYSFVPLAKSIIFPRVRINDNGRYPHDHLLMSLLRNYPTEFLNYIYFKRLRKQVVQFLSDNQIDILHFHMPYAAFIVSELGHLKIPTIATPHGEHILRGDIPSHILVRPYEKWKARRFKRALKKANRVVHVSNYMLDDFEGQGFISGGGSTVIYNGVNISEVQAGLKSTLKLQGEFNLLFPGGAKAIKRGDLLVKSLPMVKREVADIHLYIALDVPKNHLLRKMVKVLGLEENVTFTGFLAPEEYLKLLNSVDLLILPSRREAFPIVCLEAMALGKPIIASKVGGIPELVKDGRNGILVEPDPDKLAEQTLRLYRDKDLRREIKQHNLQDITRYDWSVAVDRYMEVYREVSGRE